ncbi:MAG: Rid family detoxifying hydrolase [bacterium]
MSNIEVINTNDAPAALGHYSQAIRHNELIYVSGQLPIDPCDPDKNFLTAAEQTTQTLKNIQAILNEAGSDISKVLKAEIYISDLALWAEVNQAYAEFFGRHKPARAAVPVTGLPKGFFVEIAVQACC